MNERQKKAAGKTLKRCSVCGRFHAVYLVEDEQLGKLILCSDCWKSRQADSSEKTKPPAKNPKPGHPQAEDG